MLGQERLGHFNQSFRGNRIKLHAKVLPSSSPNISSKSSFAGFGAGLGAGAGAAAFFAFEGALAGAGAGEDSPINRA